MQLCSPGTKQYAGDVVLQENILTRIHKHLAHDVDEASCQELHCIPHQKFAMTIVEQV